MLCAMFLSARPRKDYIIIIIIIIIIDWLIDLNYKMHSFIK